MSAVDAVILGMLVVVGLVGWQQGAIRSVLSMGGALIGGVVAAIALPWVLESVGALGTEAALISIGLIVVGVGVGNALAVALGSPVWRRLQVGVGRMVDAALGALVSVVAALLVMWLMAATVTALPAPAVSRMARSSAVLSEVDRWVPAQAAQWAYSVRDLLDDVRLPEVFFGLGNLPGSQVEPPPKSVSTAAVRASQSVVRVWGPTPSCGQGSTGSGFVYAPDRVATNAHVVAGMSEVVVSLPDGSSRDADVVAFDAAKDVAVLSVPGLGLPSLPASSLRPRQPGVIAGYPGGGALSLRSARVVAVTDESPVFSDDIYGQSTRPRNVYVVRGTVRPGNSGGPLLTRDGEYVGIVFASSRQFPRTGFALTSSTVGRVLAQGERAQAPVATGRCAR